MGFGGLRAATAALAGLALATFSGCGLRDGEEGIAPGEAVHVTFIHTTDQHSRLVPYNYDSTRIDEDLGIDQNYAPFGGIARAAHLIKGLRADSYRSLYLDTGDSFQGAPIFNFFQGEVEMKALSILDPDAYALGNHDFDSGSRNLYDRIAANTAFTPLAANYIFLPEDDPRGIYLGERVRPVVFRNVHGLRIGIIGMGNLSTMTSVGEGGNSLGIQPLEEVQVLQGWIDFVEPQCDLVVLVSHLGLDEDERVVRMTHGLDLVFGGHHHVVLSPPKVVSDLSGRPVPVIHSGVFLKFVGALDAVVQDGEVVSTQFKVYPVDSRLPEDRETLEMIEPYLLQMNQQFDLRRVLAYAPKLIPRYGKISGDSALGDLVTEAMQRRRQVETDFALTNSLGIRADFAPGPVTEEMLFNVFPFENYVTKMMLSGKEVVEMLDFISQRSANRGCQSQAQLAGMRFKMHCLLDEPTGSWADEVYIGQRFNPATQQWEGGERIVGPRTCYRDKTGISPLSFDVAVNDYIARGGSGFYMLKVNTSKLITTISLRTVVADHLRKLPSCGSYCGDDKADAESCGLIRKCVEHITDYYAESCRIPWKTCSRNSDCADGKSCVKGICETCAGGECSGYVEPPTCKLSTTGGDPQCGAGMVCDPLRAGDSLGPGDVLFCYDEDCWKEAEKLDPTRVPHYCRADIDQACVTRMRALAEEQCPDLPCVMTEEDGRIGKMTTTVKELPDTCAPEPEDTTAQPLEEDRCESEGICW